MYEKAYFKIQNSQTIRSTKILCKTNKFYKMNKIKSKRFKNI